MDEARHAILCYCVSRGVSFRAKKSTKEKANYRCLTVFGSRSGAATEPPADACRFRVYVSFERSTHTCVVREANLNHTCPIDTHRKFRLANSQRYRAAYDGRLKPGLFGVQADDTLPPENARAAEVRPRAVGRPSERKRGQRRSRRDAEKQDRDRAAHRLMQQGAQVAEGLVILPAGTVNGHVAEHMGSQASNTDNDRLEQVTIDWDSELSDSAIESNNFATTPAAVDASHECGICQAYCHNRLRTRPVCDLSC